MKHLNIILVIVAIAIAGYFAVKKYNQPEDKIKKHDQNIDSLNNVIHQGYDSIYKLNYAISLMDKRIKEILGREILLQLKYDQTSKFYENKISSFRGATDSSLDSFLLATYPDTTAERGHRDRPDQR